MIEYKHYHKLCNSELGEDGFCSKCNRYPIKGMIEIKKSDKRIELLNIIMS